MINPFNLTATIDQAIKACKSNSSLNVSPYPPKTVRTTLNSTHQWNVSTTQASAFCSPYPAVQLSCRPTLVDISELGILCFTPQSADSKRPVDHGRVHTYLLIRHVIFICVVIALQYARLISTFVLPDTDETVEDIETRRRHRSHKNCNESGSVVWRIFGFEQKGCSKLAWSKVSQS